MPEQNARDLERLREDDPVGWLLDKAQRRVALDLRGRGNAAAVARVCELAERPWWRRFHG